MQSTGHKFPKLQRRRVFISGHFFDKEATFRTMEYFTYVLQSQKDNRLYFGQTNNLEKRLEVHNSGKSTYTKSFKPWDIVAYRSFSSRKEAVGFEKKLKNLKS